MNSFHHFPSTNQIDNRMMMLLLPLLNHIQFHENDWLLGKIQNPCRYLPWTVQQAWGLVASRTHSWGPWACVPPVHPRKKAYKITQKSHQYKEKEKICGTISMFIKWLLIKHHTVPGWSKEDTIHTSKCGEWNKHRHDPPHYSVQSFREHLQYAIQDYNNYQY